MQKLLLFTLLFAFISCTEEDIPEEIVTSCFEVSKTNVRVGEEIQITNCSKGAVEYKYIFGNGKTSTERAPSISYDVGGDYAIELEVKAESGKVHFSQKIISVDSIENNYLYPTSILGDTFFPIEFGFDDGKFFYIEASWNGLTGARNVYNYREIDQSYNFLDKKFLADRLYNGSRASITNLSNGGRIVSIVRSLTDRIGVKEVRLGENWDNAAIGNYLWKVTHGSLAVDNKYIHYGAHRILDSGNPDFSLYKSPSIEIRNDLGEILERKTYYEIEQGFIGDLIKVGDGYIGFGGVTDPLTFSTFENYRPLVVFLDANFELTSHRIYSNTDVSNKIVSFNELNGSYHIIQLTNNNLVLYSHNEFRIIDSNGNELMKETFPNKGNIQGLLSLGDKGFVLTTPDHMKKFDLNGSLIKSLRFNGEYTPRLLLNNNNIFFVSGYSTTDLFEGSGYSVIKIFFGAVDMDLNAIDLN